MYSAGDRISLCGISTGMEPAGVVGKTFGRSDYLSTGGIYRSKPFGGFAKDRIMNYF